MNTHEQFFRATLGLSSLLVATLAAFSAHAAMSPGYAYEAGTAIVVRDGSRQCVQTTLWSKANAIKECNPELFPEPKVVAAPPPPPPPAPVAKAAQTPAAKTRRLASSVTARSRSLSSCRGKNSCARKNCRWLSTRWSSH